LPIFWHFVARQGAAARNQPEHGNKRRAILSQRSVPSHAMFQSAVPDGLGRKSVA